MVEKSEVDAAPAANQKPSRGFVYRISTSIDSFMRSSFFRLGLFVASNPIKVIIASIILMVITLAGMVRFRSESREDKLWVPTGTIALENQAWVNDNFGRSLRFTTIAFQAQAGKNLATKAAFLEMLNVAELGFNITAGPINPDGDEFNTPITFEERCINTTDSRGNSFCRTNSVFNIFYDADKNVTRADGSVNFYATVENTIKSLTDSEIRERMQNPTSTFDGSAFLPNELYATAKDNNDTFEVVLFTQFIENRAIEENGASIDEEADELEEQWTKFILDNLTESNPGNEIKWFVDSAYGQSESLGEALNGDLPLLSGGFVLLGFYVVFFLGDWHAIRSHRLLGIGALLTTGLALGSCFGLSSLLGMFFGPVHQILPLLIIGIGCDDCFHISRAADDFSNREDMQGKSIPTKVALGLSQAGAAITVTSFTNVVVFLLSAISKLPALRYFSLWAAIGIFAAWLYAITFFTACVTLDMRRIEAKRLDCCPCMKPRETVNEVNWFKQKPGAFARFFENYFGPFILRNPVRIVFLVLFAAGFGASIYGCTQLYLKFRFAFFYPSGSSQREYQDVVDDYFQKGDPTNIYIRDTKLSAEVNQTRLWDLCQPEAGKIAQNEWVQTDSITCWYDVMRQVIPPSAEYYTPPEFIAATRNFTGPGSSGARFAQDIIWDDDVEKTEVVGCRFAVRYVYRPSNDDEVNALLSVRETADSVGFGDDIDGNPSAFPYTFFDTFSEQYDALPAEIGLSLGLASIAVFAVCFVLIGHPVVASISVLVVGIIIIGVLGLTYYTGINLNSVSVITLVLCTGISVDFVVHVARAFLEHVGTRKERTIKALSQMGVPTFYAGFSTLLAIIVLAGARSYIFRVIFLGFLFLIILAFLHGLILGPIILSFIGPPSFFESEDDKEKSERELEQRFAKNTKVIEPEVAPEAEV